MPALCEGCPASIEYRKSVLTNDERPGQAWVGAGQRKHMSPCSRGRICPSFAGNIALEREEGAGNTGCRCTRSLVCSKCAENAHERSAGTTEHIRHSPRDVGRLIPRSPRRTGRYSHRRPQLLAGLTPASGCRDHAASSNASTRASSLRAQGVHRSPPHVW
jgi:hypothetical protein